MFVYEHRTYNVHCTQRALHQLNHSMDATIIIIRCVCACECLSILLAIDWESIKTRSLYYYYHLFSPLRLRFLRFIRSISWCCGRFGLSSVLRLWVARNVNDLYTLAYTHPVPSITDAWICFYLVVMLLISLRWCWWWWREAQNVTVYTTFCQPFRTVWLWMCIHLLPFSFFLLFSKIYSHFFVHLLFFY